MSTEEPSKLASTSVRAGVIASNDASLSVTTPMPVEPMSADASPAAPPATVGSVLREAREKLGLSPADIANKLRMGLKQVNALEHADYAALPTGTFLRGFVAQRYHGQCRPQDHCKLPVRPRGARDHR